MSGARINQFRDAVVATIKVVMPQLRECDSQFGRLNLEELQASSFPAPAVRVAILKVTPARQPSGRIDARLSCAAFVAAEGKDRDAAAWAMAEALALTLAKTQMWGLSKLSTPEAIEIQPLLTVGALRRGVAIIAIEWQQNLRELGDTIFDDSGALLTELYVNGEAVDLSSPVGGDDGQA